MNPMCPNCQSPLDFTGDVKFEVTVPMQQNYTLPEVIQNSILKDYLCSNCGTEVLTQDTYEYALISTNKIKRYEKGEE